MYRLEVQADGVLCETEDQKQILVPGTSVICALGQRARSEVADALRDSHFGNSHGKACHEQKVQHQIGADCGSQHIEGGSGISGRAVSGRTLYRNVSETGY